MVWEGVGKKWYVIMIIHSFSDDITFALPYIQLQDIEYLMIDYFIITYYLP